MNPTDDLQQLWNRHEAELSQQMSIDTEVLRQTNLQKVERKVNNLIQLKAATVGFYGVFAFIFIVYVATCWPNLVLMAAGMVSVGIALAFCYTSMQEIKLMKTLDYSAPLPELQQRLLKIRSTIIRYVRITIWIFPLHLAFLASFYDLVWKVDIIREADTSWLLTHLLIDVVVLIPFTIWAQTKLVPANAGKNWMYQLVRGNGSQIMDSLRLLEEVEELKRES